MVSTALRRAASYVLCGYIVFEMLPLLPLPLIAFHAPLNCWEDKCPGVLARTLGAAVALCIIIVYGITSRAILRYRRWALYVCAAFFALQLIDVSFGEFRYSVQLGHAFYLPALDIYGNRIAYSLDYHVDCCSRGNSRYAICINLIAGIGIVLVSVIEIFGRSAIRQSLQEMAGDGD